MPTLTMEADIEDGRIIPREPEKLPTTGKAIITVLDAAPKKPDWEEIRKLLGGLKTDIDVVEWQREIRSEWDERERKQWEGR